MILPLLIGGAAAYVAFRLMSANYGKPIPGDVTYRITSYVGPRISPITGKPSNHDGVDIAVPTGTPVLSVCDGVVKSAYSSSSGGLVVEVIEDGGAHRWLYLHNSELKVKAGVAVKRGDLLARAGSTGNSTGPHIHLECHDTGTNAVLDPLALGVPL